MSLNWAQRIGVPMKPGTFVRPLGLVLVIGTFLALIGPYNSHSLGWPFVWFYWVGLLGLGGAVGFGSGTVLESLFPKMPEWLVYTLVTAILSAPVSLAVVWLDGAVDGGFDLRNLIWTYPSVFVISAFVSAAAYAVTKLSQPRPPVEMRPKAAKTLTEKLPHRLREAEILSLCAEDHYLRVCTEAGDDLILMRLSDAVAACEDLDGARTHRSWWVARSAVIDARKGDGRGTLVLRDGTEVPVSRTYYPALREAGWF